MRIQYRIRYLDFLQFNVIHQFLSPTLQAVYLFFCGLIFWAELQANSPLESFLVASIFFVAMWLAQVLLLAVYLYSRRSDGILTEHIVELRDDALYESTEFNESRFFWPGVLKVVRRPGYVGVYVAQHMAHVIPLRAFASKEQAATFVAFVREKMGATPVPSGNPPN
jgi:hypothetical protein